ncbi:Putative secreted protein [[Actinomadura] parvosata subsp. kistnae]|uniref:Heavy metal-binding domain-containing protein n=1 Tax=[Actinomadura] parvosata subsp. kistnae TaxID=1909395 RepID=A0A1V0AC66_9ACTN|nr:hypothetical protein [Nonomuraea sp. ATCC 55076]AQZ67783.1 hypothetical protein BKM31_45630 [Nonomuraea sp. ATCC 55076]SPL93906.1 Putative secreted protein [Actinomadura parvosata subsp. kistnae]
MNTAMKLGSYALGLAVVFGGGLGVGKVVAPEARTSPHATRPEQQQHQQHQAADTAADTPGGLQVSQDGYTLNPITSITTGVPTDFRFTVIGPHGKPVTDYKVEHDKKLHFIVVSRDLTSFQHLHPELAPDGTWSVQLSLPKAGPYRAFADFAPAGGEKLTLGADLQAAGDYRPEPLPHVSRTAIVGDYTVNLAGDLVAGRSSKLTLTVSKNGEPVTDLEPYLGAYGHLVALRAGDLAYLHVHPEESEQAGPEITFYAEAPSRGDFRLFLDFKHEGKVRTASFTATATLSDGHAPSATHDHSH